MSFSRTWSPLLLIAALALSASCSSPGSPSSVQRPGLSSVVRIDALQVRECFGYPGPPCVVVPPLEDGAVVLGAGSYSVRVTWFNPRVSGRVVRVTATSAPSGVLAGVTSFTWPEDAYSTVPSAEPGTDGFTIRPPAGTDEARVWIELVESGPDLPEPVSVRGALVLRFRQ